jgi:hypothetical protein
MADGCEGCLCSRCEKTLLFLCPKEFECNKVAVTSCEDYCRVSDSLATTATMVLALGEKWDAGYALAYIKTKMEEVLKVPYFTIP